MTRRTIPAIGRTAALLTALVAAAAQPAPAAGGVTLTFNQAYSFPATCEPTEPLAYVEIVATNAGSTASANTIVSATEKVNQLGGTHVVTPLAPHSSLVVNFPLFVQNPSALTMLGGVHHIVFATSVTSLAVDLPFPAALCAKTPAPGPTKSSGFTATGASSAKRSPALYAQTLSAPANVRSVAAGTDCGSHVGPLGALVCPDMMKSGNLLLIWDWTPDSTGFEATGYRVYRVGRGIGLQRNPDTVIGTVANKGQTLFDVPKPAGGTPYDGMCFTVTAFAGAKESAHSPAFCAASTSVAKTATFTPTRDASITRGITNGHQDPDYNETAKFGWRKVGYNYHEIKSFAGDLSDTSISRYAMFFDVSKLVGRKLVEAHLTVNVLPTNNSRDDCTNSVGRGTEDWWNGNRWPEGTFGTPSLTLLGGQLRVDATNLVSLWIVGRPNQGIILRNDDENLGAFTNKSCVTFYGSPVLSITYY